MAKLTNVRERVHQPIRDSLIRTAGMSAGTVQDTTELFQGQGGRSVGFTNLQGSNALPADQSMCVLALRVSTWFRNPIQRGPTVTVVGGTDYPQANGDFQFGAVNSTYSAAQSSLANGSAPGSVQDVHRLYFQTLDQLFWTFGAGMKPSLVQMPTAYFPYGGGLHGDLGGATNLIFWNNGTPDHSGILRLARAVLIPPRQNIVCRAEISSLPDGGNSATFAGAQGSRSMLSLKDNLNAVDLIQKSVSFCMDGLLSRDVQ